MILIVASFVITCIVVYLKTPYSPVKKQYWEIVERFTNEFSLSKNEITEDDLEVLPVVLQKYFIVNGYLGIESTNAVILNFKGADFSMGVDKPNIKINYIVYDFVNEPIRVALIDSKIYGIPFQGIDIYKDAKSSMKGVLAKHMPLFNEEFDFIDSAYLAECLMHPSLALQNNITYKQIDEYSVEERISKDNAETTGVFYFNEDYEMTSFVVEERFCSDTNTYERWTAVVADYKVINGINIPTKFQGIWNYDSGDLIYFNSNGMKITYQ